MKKLFTLPLITLIVTGCSEMLPMEGSSSKIACMEPVLTTKAENAPQEIVFTIEDLDTLYFVSQKDVDHTP